MTNFSKWRLSIGSAMAAALASSAFVSVAYAADTSTVQGSVAGAVAGETVTATNVDTGASVTVSVQADGRYVIVGLRPGHYRIRAGQGVTNDVILVVGETATVDLDVAANETITVVGRRGREVRTSEVATVVTQAQIANLPQNDRNFLNFAGLAPGVVVSTDPERKSFRAGAGTDREINVFIDGQSYKNNVLQGGVAGQDASKGNPFPQLAVQEFKVSTQNFKAEYEQAGTAIISAATKTGGDEFHGSFLVDFVNKDMFGQPYYSRSGPKGDYQRYQYGADIGGPIIKDKLHFYYAFEGTDQTNPSATVDIGELNNGAPIGGSAATDQAFRDRYEGVFGLPFEQQLHFGKLTFYATPDDTINISAFVRTEFELEEVGGNRTYESRRENPNDVSNYTIEWEHRADNFLSEASLAYQKYSWAQKAVTNGPQFVLTRDNSDRGNQVASFGGHFYTQEKAQTSWTYRHNLTFTGIQWHGDHVVKMGGKIAKFSYDPIVENNSKIPSFYYDARTFDINGTNTPYGTTILLNPDTNISSENTQLGFFIQDDWTLNEHWTFNLGLRWDFESNMMNDRFITPKLAADALRNYDGFINAGLNPDNYINDGGKRDKFYGAWQPRLGVSYDVYGDRQLVFFAGAGRYYDRTFYDATQNEERSFIREVVSFNFGVDGPAFNPNFLTNYDALRAAAQTASSGGDWNFLPNDLKVPYTDQFNIGVRKQFGDIAASLTIARQNGYNGFEFVRGNREPDGSYSPYGDHTIRDWFGPGSSVACATIDCRLVDANDVGHRIEIGRNDVKSRYNAIYLTLEKPFTEDAFYGFNTTLTLADSESNGFEGIFNFTGANSDAQGYHKTNGVEEWRFVGSALVRGPWNTILSTNMIFASGAPFGSIDASPDRFGTGNADDCSACFAVYQQGAYLPKEDVAYEQVDLRISKDIDLPMGHRAQINAQVFNVFDTVNRTYSAWGGGSNWGGGASLEPDNNTVGPARTYQVGLRYQW